MSNDTLTDATNGGNLDSNSPQNATPPGLPGALSSQDLSGGTLAGYKLVRKIAEGGMGVVYEAIQLKLDRKVALKVLTEQLGWRPEFLQRFEREAKAAAALSHPNMVQVFDYGEAAGRHYIIMEFIEGENLTAYTEELGKLSIDEALNLVEQAAQALKAAAAKSIIHRDIKPSNLLLTKDGRVKVADLGLAKILSQDSELTLSSVSIGSPHFIAPEQADDSRSADHRADIYSLGVTLLFLLTGKHAYDGNSPISIVLAHTNKRLPSGTELGTTLPDEVETLIRRMAAKDPNERYQDYQSLIVDLNRVRAGQAPTATVGKKAERKSKIVLVGAIAACVLIVAGATIYATRSKTKAPVQTATATQISFSPQADQTPVPNVRPGPQDRVEGQNGESRRLPPDQEGQGERGGGGPFDVKHPIREFYEIPDGPPATMLAAADQYADKHVQNYEEILDGYSQVQRKAEGTRVGPQVAGRIEDWTGRQQKARKEAMETREKQMQELAKAGKPQEALHVWHDFPPGLRNRETDGQIRQIIERTIPAPDRRPPSVK